MDAAALAACFAGGEPFADLDNVLALPHSFVGKHPGEAAPSVIACGFPELEALLDGRHIQVLDADNVILFCQAEGNLVQQIIALMLGFRMQLGDTLLLLIIIAGTLDHMGQLALLSGNTSLYPPVWLIKVRNLAVGTHIQLG